jgi:hypothetical protein
MTAATYRGVVRGGIIVLRDGDASLQDGTEVLVTPVSDRIGSAQAVLAAVRSGPKVPADWVDELERLIAEGRRPPSNPDLFQDEPTRPESP